MILINALLALPLVLLGFTLISSLAARVSENHWWMLSAGLLCSLVLPGVLASWLRALRRGFRARRARRPAPGEVARPPAPVYSPSTVGTVVMLNLAVLAGAVTLAPALTREALFARGTWWVQESARLAGTPREHPLVVRAEAMIFGLADLVPGEAEAQKPRRARRPTAPPPASPQDGGPEHPPGEPPLEPGPEPVTLPGDGEVRVSFQRRGSTGIVVPVTLYGPAGAVPVRMLFDTGATLSTVDRATLARLGLRTSPLDPIIESHTANGAVKRPITVVEGVEMQGAKVGGGLTFTLCDPCATGKVVGLLGLNFSRHFRVTVDHDAGEIVLQPKPVHVGHLFDIRHFVSLDEAKGLWRGPLLSIKVLVRNRSPRPLQRVVVEAEVKSGEKSGRIRGTLAQVPARGEARLTLEGRPGVKGSTFLLRLAGARW